MLFRKEQSVWIFYIVLKLIYTVLAFTLYREYTSLGDTEAYLRGSHFDLSSETIFNSTALVGTLSYLLANIFGFYGANIFFALLSVYGVFYSVKRLNLEKKELMSLLAFLSLPNFGVWTSVASKEAVGVFFMGIILGFVIDIIKKNKIKNYTVISFAFYLCGIFKPQYLIGIGAVLIFCVLSRGLRLKGFEKLFLIWFLFIASFLVLYLFRHEISQLSLLIPVHFPMDAGSTRIHDIFVNKFDVFWNAPYGIFIGFMGPTLAEALIKPTHLAVLLESYLILFIFLFLLLKLILMCIATGKLNVFLAGVFIIGTFWILLVHYPVAALNPGSALRYRQNFFPFLSVLFYFCYLEVKKGYFDSKRDAV